MGGREFLRVLAEANIINMSFKDQGFLGARFEKDLLLSAQDSSVSIVYIIMSCFFHIFLLENNQYLCDHMMYVQSYEISQ